MNWKDDLERVLEEDFDVYLYKEELDKLSGFISSLLKKQVNQAKIDENKHWENICFEQAIPSIKRNDFITRSEYLEKQI